MKRDEIYAMIRDAQQVHAVLCRIHGTIYAAGLNSLAARAAFSSASVAAGATTALTDTLRLMEEKAAALAAAGA